MKSLRSFKSYNQKKLKDSGIETLVTSCAECFRTFALDYELDEMKVMHTTEFITQQGFDVKMAVEEDRQSHITIHVGWDGR